MRILPAKAEHIEGIVAIDLIIGSERRRVLAGEAIRDELAWVAMEDEVVAGFLLAHRHFFAYPFINLLAVQSSYRRHGVGMSLMRRAEAAFRPGKLFTSTNRSNLPMQRLCERLGYISCGIVEHIDDGDPELIYYKRLA